jgi:adenylate cyclase
LSELLVLNGACAGTVFFLPDVPTVVGRSPESHLQISDPWISSMHAMFERREADIWIVDLESRNGTFLGEQRVAEARLEPGVVLKFGKTEVRFEQRGDSERPERLLGDGRAVVRYLDDLEAELEEARKADPRRDTVRSDPAPQALARRQLAALEEIGRTLVDAPDLEACLHRILGAVARAVDADRSSLLLADERGTMIPRAVEPEGAPPAFSSTVIAAAAQSRAGILTVDAQHDARFQGKQSVVAQGLRSVMCVPLSASGRVLGMLLFDRPQPEPFAPEDLDLVAVVGNQAALAIERARFFERHRVGETRRRALAEGFPPEVALAAAEPAQGDPLALALREGTVLHAMLHGAGALAAQVGPGPVASERVRAALDALAAAALAEGGAVTRVAAAGVVVIFGLPAPSRDAPLRAVRAARAMRDALRAIGPALGLRAGLEHGRVLAGNVAGAAGFELAILGGVADHAAELATSARAGEILVGEGARGAGVTDVVASGERHVGGVAVPVFRVG